MQHLEIPDPKAWETRREWYEAHIFHYEEQPGGYLVGEQASALLFDVQCCFCAGAWVSVLLVAYFVIEAHLRETDPGSFKKRSFELIRDSGWEEKLNDLRKLRNRLVHAKYSEPTITIDQQWDDRESLEEQARKAISLMFEVFYSDRTT